MKLTRIRLEQFRQFRKPLEIKGLSDGLNLFTGPNEAGKSTVVAAVRAAFFERHRSSSVDDLRPWGDSTASPSVELDFTLADQPYRLSKSFLGKKRCELQAGSRRLDGEEAEEHLASLLGFQYAGKGASAERHWGIPGLLWVQQGSGQDLHAPVLHATDHLRRALDLSLGAVASSGGDQVLASVEAQRNELLTPSGGLPRGSLAEALKRQTQLEAELQASDSEVASYRQKVDLLGSLRREQAADDADKPWTAFRAQEQEARHKLAAAERVATSLQADQERATRLDAHILLLRHQLESLGAQEAAAKTRAADAEAAQQALQAAGRNVEHLAALAATAEAAHHDARRQLRQVREQQARDNLLRERLELQHKAQATQTRLHEAEAAQAHLHQLQAQAAALQIGAEVMHGLREQHRQLRELQIQRAAFATRLRFKLADGHVIELGEPPHAQQLMGSGTQLLLAPTTLHLGMMGELEISPGGSDLQELGRQEAALSDEHAARLLALGLASLDEAEARYQAHGQRAAEQKAAAATLKAHAPKGLDALRGEAMSLAARAQELEAAVAKLAVAPASTSTSTSTSTSVEVAVEAPATPTNGAAEASPPTLAEAEAAEDHTRREREHINARLNQARVAVGNAQAQAESTQRELRTAQALLLAPERADTLQTTRRALVDRLAEEAALAAEVRAKTEAVAQARPALLKQDIERFGNSAMQLERAFDERKSALLRLEGELENAGTQGLDERRATAARDLAQHTRRAAELQRRAAALDHLLKRLKDKRNALTQRLREPLQKHLTHYLQLLFPQAQLAIDDQLTPGPLTRPGAAGSESGLFDTLSFGAREQLGLISRLAYADLLREAGQPTLIILDDALVHSDEDRLGLMKRVLFDAATRHQILLFTCHPLNWRDLGVAPRSMASLHGPAMA